MIKSGAILFGAIISLCLGVVGFLLGAAFESKRVLDTSDSAAILLTGFIAGAIAIVTAVIAIWGIYSQRVLVRRQATIEHIARLEADQTVMQNIQKFISLTLEEGNLARWADKEHDAGPEASAIRAVLNDYELIAIGIQRGIFEYKLVHDWNRTSIQRYWSKAHPFVVALRDRVGAQTLWQEFEKLNGWVQNSGPPLRALWWAGIG